MTDRDIEIGRLQGSVDHLRVQSGTQFTRIDGLEERAARPEERIDGLRGRLDAMGAPKEKTKRLPDIAYSWRMWIVLGLLLGALLGAWTLDDVRGLLLPVAPGEVR